MIDETAFAVTKIDGSRGACLFGTIAAFLSDGTSPEGVCASVASFARRQPHALVADARLELLPEWEDVSRLGDCPEPDDVEKRKNVVGKEPELADVMPPQIRILKLQWRSKRKSLTNVLVQSAGKIS